MDRTSASLLKRLRLQPDSASWEQFVGLYAPLVHGWLMRCGLQESDARDIGQDVMVTLLRELPKFEYDRQKGKFRSWLRHMVSNRVLMFWRQRRRSADRVTSDVEGVFEKLADPHSDLARRWDEEHDRHVAAQILQIVKPDFEPTTWQAFWRSVVDGQPAQTVAADLNISTNAVYLAKSRVLRRLQQEAEGLLD
jgi:RNA polymerase sigma-70 factor (ECF subfamily)